MCVGRAPENNDGQGWKQTYKNAPSRHIMWAALADCVAIVLCQLTCVMSGYPVSKPLALPREYTAQANSNCTERMDVTANLFKFNYCCCQSKKWHKVAHHQPLSQTDAEFQQEDFFGWVNASRWERVPNISEWRITPEYLLSRVMRWFQLWRKKNCCLELEANWWMYWSVWVNKITGWIYP